MARILRVADIGNAGDGSDVFVAVDPASNESTVTEYRLFVVKQTAAATFDTTVASGVPAARFTAAAPRGAEIDTTLSTGATDTDGDAIVEGMSYVSFVLVVVDGSGSTGNQLSSASAPFTLARTNIVLTLTDAIRAGSGGMDVDAAGSIYAADFGTALNGTPGTRVFKITPDGVVSVFATGLSGASGNAFDSQGNLFQSNIASSTISKIAPDGTVSFFTSQGISNPVGIAIDSTDNLFVANCGNNTIQKVTPAGVSTAFAASALFSCPNGIALASDGNLYVANFGNGAVVKVDSNGIASSFVTLPGNNNGHILFANGVLYVVARTANRIYQVTLGGVPTLLAGNGTRGLWDGAAKQARLSLTNDIAISPDGTRLYFNDVVNSSGTNILSPIKIRMVILDEP